MKLTRHWITAEMLQGLDAYMEYLLKDWNAPGVGVVNDIPPIRRADSKVTR